jgi:hypothetical protein
MMWSKHSRRIDPINRSAKPFCQDEAGAVGVSVPDAHGAQSTCDDGTIVSFGPLIADCCQSPFKFSGGTTVALAPSELVRVAETARAGLIRSLPTRHWIARAG